MNCDSLSYFGGRRLLWSRNQALWTDYKHDTPTECKKQSMVLNVGNETFMTVLYGRLRQDIYNIKHLLIPIVTTLKSRFKQ